MSKAKDGFKAVYFYLEEDILKKIADISAERFISKSSIVNNILKKSLFIKEDFNSAIKDLKPRKYSKNFVEKKDV